MFNNWPNHTLWSNIGGKYTIHVWDLMCNRFDFGLGPYTLLDGNQTDYTPMYPIFDEKYRITINDMILKHFIGREIGYETEGFFKYQLISKLNEVMPKYNTLFNARILANVDPGKEYDETTRHKETAKSKVTGRQSDTPQQSLDNLGVPDDESFVNKYLSYGSINDTSAERQLDDTSSGRHKSNAALSAELAECAFDIETQLLRELDCLFMGLFD